MSVNRRSFIGSIVAFVLAPFAPKLAPTPQGLMLHPDAFKLTMEPVSIRFIRAFDPVSSQWVNRFDTFYGLASFENTRPLPMSQGYRDYIARDAALRVAQ